jgi:hypothetical protein
MMLFECTVRFNANAEDGISKKVTEVYLVDAQTFAEAETRAFQNASQLTTGSIDMLAIKRSNITVVVMQDPTGEGQKWFKAKLNYITIDEKTAKEKKQAVYYAVYASDIDNAHRFIDANLGDSVMDYEVAAINDTKIVEFVAHV